MTTKVTSKKIESSVPIPIPGKLYRVKRRQADIGSGSTWDFTVEGRYASIPLGSIIMCIDSWVEQTTKTITYKYMVEHPVQRSTFIRLSFLFGEKLYERCTMSVEQYEERFEEILDCNTP